MNAVRLPVVLALVGLMLAPRVRAVTYQEVGDAGDLPGTAQAITGTSGTPLTQISGMLALTNNTSDSDMFEIDISNTSTFAVSMPAARGTNNFDSQLMIFNAAGKGVFGDDDAASGSPQAAIPAGTLASLPTGLYYVLVSGSGRYAVNSSAALIFPNYTDGVTNPPHTVAPNNAAAAVITGYTGYSSEAGNYALTLAGAQVVPVPEPGTVGVLGGALAAMALWRGLRRRPAATAVG